MLKFILGVILGAGLAVGYVRYEIELPEFLQLTDKLRGNLVTTAIETELYDLDADIAKRQRALEIYFANRPQKAVEVDAAFRHPFLEALYRTRAIREARLLRNHWDAFDTALEKPELRAVLELKHGASGDLVLKQRMLLDTLERSYPFLARWLKEKGEPLGEAELLETAKRIGVLPQAAQ